MSESHSRLSPDDGKTLQLPSIPAQNRPKLNTPQPTTSRIYPQLFQAPSRNNSHISLNLPGSSPSTLGSSPQSNRHQPQQPSASKIPAAASFSGPSLRDHQSANKNAAATQSEDLRADALWAEMQNTLAEVELSTMNSSHVFGASHSRALEDLRTSQLALAQAWAKSEADEMGDHEGHWRDGEQIESAGSTAVIGTLREGMLGAGASPNAAKKGKESADKNSTAKDRRRSSKSLEEETERDILLARKRREANDRYFEQVNSGVLDVVRKLEEVATAMRKVEKASREIWSEESQDSDDGADGRSASVLTGSPKSQRR